MKKNIYKQERPKASSAYLTPKEQEVFRLLSKAEIMSHEEAKGLFPDARNLNKTLHSLVAKGYLYRLRKGLYLVSGAEGLGGVAIKDPFRIASALYGGYIGLSSALRLYGLLDYETFTTFSVTSGTSEEKRIGSYLFKAVNFGRRATGQHLVNGVYVSTPAKTFFDCLYRPNYINYQDTTKALYQSEDVDWREFLSYFSRFASPALCQRTGYILETLAKETGFSMPGNVLSYLRSRIKNRTRLMPSNKDAGKYDSEWKVMDNLGFRNILSWWYNG